MCTAKITDYTTRIPIGLSGIPPGLALPKLTLVLPRGSRAASGLPGIAGLGLDHQPGYIDIQNQSVSWSGGHSVIGSVSHLDSQSFGKSVSQLVSQLFILVIWSVSQLVPSILA